MNMRSPILALSLAVALCGLPSTPAPAAPPVDVPKIHHPMGWRSDPHHSRGLVQIVHAPGFGAVALPAAATVRQWFYFTNQKDGPSCTAFSAVECLDALYMKNGGQWAHPSFLDFWQQELKHDGTWPKSEGSYTSTILWVMVNSTVCPEKNWPYITANLGVNPPQCAVKARSIGALVAYDVPNDDGGYAVKNCIATLNIPVVTGGAWPNSWMSPRKDPVTGRWYVGRAGGGNAGGHEVSIISFDDSMKVGSIKGFAEIHNHWENAPGVPWGDSIGSCWVPQADLFNAKLFEDNGTCQSIKPQKP